MDLIKSKLTSALRHLPTILVALVFLSTFDPVMALVFPQPKHNEPNVQKEKGVKKSEITIGQTYFDEGTDNLDIVREHRDDVVVEEKKPEPPKADEIFKAVEQMPRYPGGEAALMADISKNIRYPAMAAENNIQGCVVVQFVVEKNGSVGQVKVVRGKDPDLDKEAMRVCKTLKKFNPGKMNGVNVRVWYTLPINFKLQSNEINGHAYVDLGLSVKWATCNVGADKPEDYGDYFAWGEISPKSSYDEDNSMTYGVKFGDISGNPNYDVARAKLGRAWRLPTRAEQDELCEKCDWTRTTRNGVKGYQVKSKINGNSIFLPAAGYRYGTSLNYAGSYGFYWNSTPYESNSYRAYYLLLYDGYVDWNYGSRHYGFSARPVSE